MMGSNFEFLNRYWPVLAQLGANAENYLYSDPNACIYKIGLFSERCRAIWAEWTFPTDERTVCKQPRNR